LEHNNKGGFLLKPRRILITGGAGFIGSNLANRLLSEGEEIGIFDNLSRSGCHSNIDWLRKTYGSDSFRLIKGDITDFESLKSANENMDVIYHLAGQVAVTTSVKEPMKDFMDNALETVNVLEAARQVGNDPVVLYASTNKVYGCLEKVPVVEEETRYRFDEFP
jgi:CDP-paratose 2-epimerase